MITLRIEPHLFTALCAGVDAGACDDGPVEQEQVADLRLALGEAAASALPGLPIVLTLDSVYELFILADCFQVGAEFSSSVTDDQVAAILALLEQARPPT